MREWMHWRKPQRTLPMRRVFIAFVAVCSLTSPGVFGQTPAATGRVEGAVFVGVSSGHAFAAGATVRLSGPVVLETETDENGNYTFAAVASGTYRIEAFLSGLDAAQTISVEAGKIVRAELQLKPADVKSSVTVTATASETKDPAPSETISEKTLRDAPNVNERFESSLPLVPGVLRGPDGHINLKGARNTQSGALVNSANVTDPATGGQAINLPIDVVSSVQVISNPYDPEYGKFTGAVSSVETRTSNLEKFHLSAQNFVPRARDRDGHIVGIGAFTPRVTLTGPIMKDRLAFTQSFEYRFVRTPVESLPPLQRDTKLESFDSFSQFDLKINEKQTATLSVAVFPQKLDYLGLNTFNPQPSTPNLHQRGYQISAQHHFAFASGALLTSQLAYESFDADLFANGKDPYRLLVET